jgi:hypothetical protein
MKRTSLIITTIALCLLVAQAAPAQFTLKMPKIPKVEKPKAETSKPDGVLETKPESQPKETSRAGGASNSDSLLRRVPPTGVPRFMIDTVEIKVKSDSHYWKAPGQDYYTSWVPQVSFGVFFDNSTKVRYNAEWYNADGSLWYTEPLDVGVYSADATVKISSPYSGELFQTKATVAIGTYGLKVVNTKTSETIFQGKFKVNKIPLEPGDARRKNQMLFYVDNDWTLPTGYVGFSYTDTYYDFDPRPIVWMWFKGDLEAKDFEARLYHNGQEVATTDDGGSINNDRTFGDDCFMKVELCKYRLWYFYWTNFIVENGQPGVREKYPKATYTRDKPGEYTVKIFHRGTQVREAKFTIDNKGWVAPNSFSNQIFLTNYRIAVPVKVMGTLDKWNPATGKTEQFYGNPLTGFATQ